MTCALADSGLRGSSGKPLVFYFDRRRQAYDAAARALTHQWWGVDIGDKELYLWGSPLEITKQDKIKDLRDWLTNDLLISAFEISVNKVPVPDCYGSREGGFVCHECREGRYHVIEPNYIIEFLREGSAAGTGEDGEVVLTHLDAWGMPLIRYRTGDVAVKFVDEIPRDASGKYRDEV